MNDFVSGGRVAAPFGLGRNGKRDHTGVDVSAPKGTPILAPDDALVVEALSGICVIEDAQFDGLIERRV